MKTPFLTVAVITLCAAPALAGSRIDRLCGTGHVNESAHRDDILANPDGYYIRSLQVQLSHGDPRIQKAVGTEFHLCTRAAATPDMDTTRALLLRDAREVKFLFVPTDCPEKPSS